MVDFSIDSMVVKMIAQVTYSNGILRSFYKYIHANMLSKCKWGKELLMEIKNM